MSKIENAVRLLVNGVEFGGWKSVRIGAGIERQARSFDLSVTDRWPGSRNDIPRRVRAGDVCEIYIGADRVLTGYVDGTPIKYTAKTVTVGVGGRSKTADLVDCCPVQGTRDTSGAGAGGNRWAQLGVQSATGSNPAPAARAIAPNAKGGSGGQWRAAKLEQIAADMAAEYGVKVVAEVDTGAPLSHQVQQGETVFESIDRMLRMRHCLATDNALGELVFVVAGSGGKATTSLELGRNIREGDAPLNFSKVFSEYICKGQKAVSNQQADNDDAGDDVDAAIESSIGSSANVTDNRVNRRRVLVLRQSGQADEGTVGDRVNFERANRAAKALETVYVVDGWRQEDGALWVQNQQVRVIDTLIGFDAEMLIAEVTYLLDDEGQRTELRVGPLDGYVSAAQKKQKKANTKIVKDRYAAGGLGVTGVNE